jgi:hypothetical protein
VEDQQPSVVYESVYRSRYYIRNKQKEIEIFRTWGKEYQKKDLCRRCLRIPQKEKGSLLESQERDG